MEETIEDHEVELVGKVNHPRLSARRYGNERVVRGAVATYTGSVDLRLGNTSQRHWRKTERRPL